LNRREVRTAFEHYVHPDYRQHNPAVPDGREGVIDALGAWVTANPRLRYDIKQVIAEGDRVVIFAHVTPYREDRGNAAAQMAHRNGMF